MNIRTAISKAKYLLESKNIRSSELDCELLMSKVLKKDRNYILLNLDKNLKKKILIIFKVLLKKDQEESPLLI